MSSQQAILIAADEPAKKPHVEPGAEAGAGRDRIGMYVPRILQQRLVSNPGRQWWTAEGTAAFVDISGFTKLSERLARKGREGSEQITDAIGGSFESLLEVAYGAGAGLIKFGGDALLLWFQDDGHAARACQATVQMRRVLRKVGRIEVPGAKVTLRMSQGVHSGEFHFFAVGTSHLELLPVGPGWSRVVEMEHEASAGEILVSSETASMLPDRCLGEAKGTGRFLMREPLRHVQKLPLVKRPDVPIQILARGLSPSIRAHVQSGGGTSEHRPVTIAFIHFDGTDALLERMGPQATADALDQLVSVVQEATEEQEVSFLCSDVDFDGGKLILTAGAPKITGDDEERMLLALRRIIDSKPSIPIRIGVNRGSVFAGDIGPFYRRTYTVMGDAVNLSARLMAKAESGAIYATADVLERSDTLFATTELAPFSVKGKAQPVRAWSVGRAVGSRTRQVAVQQLKLIGRDAELETLRKALDDARAGTGRVVEIVGEAGLGKTRLLQELTDRASGFGVLHAVCEAYSASTPYALWRELLREALGFGRDDPDDAVAQRLREVIAQKTPELTPWMSLIAIALGLEIPPSAEVEMMTEQNRKTKLYEATTEFLATILPRPGLIVIENAHHIDRASAELLAYVTGVIASHGWVVGVARRPSASAFKAQQTPALLHIELAPLTAADALRMTKGAAEQHPLPLHVLEAVATRSGGNPQFLRDLVRAAITSGGLGGLPESAEAATMARIDALTPEDRNLVRRAAVLGLTFHPRMLSWLDVDGDAAPADPAAFERLKDLFEDEGDGYVRFGRSLLRDAAYEGLPYKVRRRLHGAVAARLEAESDNADEVAGILSLHYFEAGEYGSAWRYAGIAGKRAQAIYAYIEAAGLYARALIAGRRLTDVAQKEFADMYAAQADCLYRAAEYVKASDSYMSAYRLSKGDPVEEAALLLKRSWVEEKLGKLRHALSWAARARNAVKGLEDREALRQAARSSSWYASVLHRAGRASEALRWAEEARVMAEAADDPEALGAAYYVMGAVKSSTELLERALEAFRRSGDVNRQTALLSDLGVLYWFEGRWSEALSYYQRCRAEAQKIGSTVIRGLARMNIAEILIDRGELAEAEEELMDTLPLWKASRYRYLLGQCQSLLGRLSLRGGYLEVALKWLEEAKANFQHVGATDDIALVDARIAECWVAMGRDDEGLTLVEELLGRAGSAEGKAKLVPQLRRIRAYALQQRGDSVGAKQELETSLAAGRARNDLFEIALTLHAMIELCRLENAEPPAEMMAECGAIIESLEIKVLAAVPFSPR